MRQNVNNYVEYKIVNNTHDTQSFKGGGAIIILYKYIYTYLLILFIPMWDIRPQCLFSTDDGLEQSPEQSPIVRPMSESSVVMVLLHVDFGRPLLRFPVGVHLRATFGI